MEKTGGELVPPSRFIPLAEQTGFITEMTQYGIPRIISDINTLNTIDDSLFVTFNVSANDFSDDEFLGFLSNSISSNLKLLKNFCIEITETYFLPSDPRTKSILHAIDEMGLSIILNDFSAGYTSFSTLAELPVKAIKIAMEVTQKAPFSRKGFRLFRHLVSMAHQLQMEIIAEGVEDEETHMLINSVGCTHSQGYLYGRPMPLSDFISLQSKDINSSGYPFGLEYLAQIDLIDFRRDVIRASLLIGSQSDTDIRDRALKRLPELKHQDCLFGKWYEKMGYQKSDDQVFIRLGHEHQFFHDLANDLLFKAKSGKQAEEINQAIYVFAKQFEIVMDLLQKVELENMKMVLRKGLHRQ